MKTISRLLLAVLVTATSPAVFAGTPATIGTARILGGVPDGTPPPPEPPKRGFTVKAANVLSSKTQQQGGRILTLGEIKPIALPAPRKPTPPAPTDPATYALLSGKINPATLTAIQSLHALYQSEQPRLLTAHQGRERTRLQEEAQLKAHPPQPKNSSTTTGLSEKAPQPQ